jgi:hypothetical protein
MKLSQIRRRIELCMREIIIINTTLNQDTWDNWICDKYLVKLHCRSPLPTNKNWKQSPTKNVPVKDTPLRSYLETYLLLTSWESTHCIKFDIFFSILERESRFGGCWKKMITRIRSTHTWIISLTSNMCNIVFYLWLWPHLWYMQRPVFGPFSDLYFLQNLWDWLVMVVDYANLMSLIYVYIDTTGILLFD